MAKRKKLPPVYKGNHTYALDEKTLAIMQDALVTRFGPELDEWNEAELGCALAGEVGELCNMLKKRKRKKFTGDTISTKKCGKEMADTLSYLLILAEKLGVDMSAAFAQKYNEVARRKKSKLRVEVV